MRSDAPALVPIFRSAHQAELLALLLFNPDIEFTATDVARRLGVPASTLHPEVRRLVTAQLIEARSVGRTKMLSANRRHPLTRVLTELLTLTYGPRHAVAEAFEGLAGVQRVLIFGSWAARYQGEHGPPPNDLDVLVIGAPQRADVYDAADRVQQRIGLEVNPVLRRPEDWASDGDPLVRQIKSGLQVTVLPADDEKEDRAA